MQSKLQWPKFDPGWGTVAVIQLCAVAVMGTLLWDAAVEVIGPPSGAPPPAAIRASTLIERLVVLCRAPWKGAVFQRVRNPPGNFRSSR